MALMPFMAIGQRLESIGKDPLLKITGSMSVNQIAYMASGIDSRRDPYTIFATASLNLDIYGWVMPFSFSYSNQGKGSFQQPFNQYAIHPTYKWITAHAGYQSISLSSYTVNGHTFSGLGLDLAPEGKWKFNVLAGRFQKGINFSGGVAGSLPVEPAYRRMGYGLKVSYGGKDQYDLILFKAKDAVNSIGELPAEVQLKPQDNLVAGFNFKKKLGKKLMLNGEIGLSVLTNDMHAVNDSAKSVVPNMGGLLTSNATTGFYKAFKTGLHYNLGKAVVGLGYERVDPEYKTLGAYYFANDLENMTGNISVRLLKDKANFSVNAGLQRNDLKKDKQSSMKRLVGAANLALNLSKRFTLTTGYSNFQSFVNIRSTFNQLNQLTPYDNLDTLNYTQISQNATIGANYVLRQDKEKASLVNVNISYMTTADKQGSGKQHTGGQFYTINSNYTLNFMPKNISFSFGLNANRNQTGPAKALTWGPTAGLNRTFFDKKLRSSLALSWNQSKGEGQPSTSVMNARLSNALVYKKKHNLNLSLVFLNRTMGGGGNALPGSRNLNEYTATLGYNYSF